MNAWVLLVPFIIVRFSLLRVINTQSVQRARHFAPVRGNETIAFVVHQITILFILGYPITLQLQAIDIFVGIGYSMYSTGILVLMAAIITFAKSKQNESITQGIYGYSRNPMYVGYFLCFLGCAMITKSGLLFLVVILFQIATHWIILSEERWCITTYGDAYLYYMKEVSRYF